ncbi:MAG: CBS/transporter associated domain protein [Labilithrix sp.]|nr:CBS/transporter associated domain protein [Labilithrix sp.]
MELLGLELLVIVALAIFNGFFSCAEIAILSVRKTRLRELAAEGNGAARTAIALRDEPERFLATVQVGITVIGATAGAFGGAVLEQPMAALLRRLGFGDASTKVAFAIVVAVVSALTVVVGELVPKSLALRYSEPITLLVSRPLSLLSRIAKPIVWSLTAASNLLLRPLRDRTNFTEARLSREELLQLVDEATAAGALDKETGGIALRAIDLGALKAFSVMTPRSKIVWISLAATEHEVARALRERPHARYPLLDNERHPAGYVVAHELYDQLLERRFDLQALRRDIPTFNERVAAVEVLRSLQRARCEIGLIVDDTGATCGLVSIEMLAEVLFGEIVTEGETLEAPIVRTGDGVFEMRGDAPIHEINRELGLDLPIGVDASTIAGCVLAAFGGFPSPGTHVTLPGGIDAEVLEVGRRRILRVRLASTQGVVR